MALARASVREGRMAQARGMWEVAGWEEVCAMRGLTGAG
jgi:hypothetical protein